MSCPGANLVCGLIFAAALAAGCKKENPGTTSAGKAPAKSKTGSSAASKTATASGATNEPVRVEARFEDDPKARDPFFPASEARVAKPGAAEPAVKKTSVLSNLVVRAVMNSRPPRAWINNRFFEPGVSGEVKLPGGGSARIKCLQIQGKDVTVEVEGVPGQHVLSVAGTR